jgi:hypothetical protein
VNQIELLGKIQIHPPITPVTVGNSAPLPPLILMLPSIQHKENCHVKVDCHLLEGTHSSKLIIMISMI